MIGMSQSEGHKNELVNHMFQIPVLASCYQFNYTCAKWALAHPQGSANLPFQHYVKYLYNWSTLHTHVYLQLIRPISAHTAFDAEETLSQHFCMRQRMHARTHT